VAGFESFLTDIRTKASSGVYKSEAELRKAEAAQPSFLPEEFAAYLGLPLSRLMEDGGPLSPSALEALKRLGVTEEQLSTLQ